MTPPPSPSRRSLAADRPKAGTIGAGEMSSTDRPEHRKVRSGDMPARVFAGLVLCGAVASLSVTATTSVRELGLIWNRIKVFEDLDLGAARNLAYGEGFGSFLRDALARIGEHEPYLLAPGPSGSQGGDLIRLLLLPRVARKYDTFRSRTPPRWIIWVSKDGVAPVFERTSEEVAWILGFRPDGEDGTSDESILAAIDRPAEGTLVSTSDLIIQGWCQELGERPCPFILVALNGRPLRMISERYPRPDVENAIDGIGDCARAGYRFRVDLTSFPSGSNTIDVYFRTADGRHRRLQRSFAR